ncbi:hypothetical protein UYO_2331 [Lachnospiraceae bacterium JC7]|nr:hypothetical protein UYO_2331 [Lachnospiraceae bacterium JC7]
MLLKNIIRCMTVTAGIITALGFTAFAKTGVKGVGAVCPIQIVVDSEHIVSKVNDPVTKKDKPAYIVSENAEFHLVSEYYSDADVIFYINEYVEEQDAGVSNRVLKKVVNMGEQVTMLPEDVFWEDVEDGSAYRFTDRCYDVRVYYGTDHKNYEDFYFGLVDEETFEKIASSVES